MIISVSKVPIDHNGNHVPIDHNGNAADGHKQWLVSKASHTRQATADCW